MSRRGASLGRWRQYPRALWRASCGSPHPAQTCVARGWAGLDSVGSVNSAGEGNGRYGMKLLALLVAVAAIALILVIGLSHELAIEMAMERG
ncbi:hypothetical protein GCM10010994_53200 [Chelatococcus reniformis]|uniref:Uncharacterized protein n=1 Tax=Chelatococcus reniformis TaxID=1494448 RepID=A0A916UUB8_9HYPH|nr:hypothetical protein GCM10010994_53200 [Chelatococcus reniformis]